MERRKTERFPAFSSSGLRLTSQEVDGEVEVKATDYSSTGLRVESPVFLGRGATVSLRGDVNLGDRRPSLHCQATVSWCMPSPRGGFLAGLAFDQPNQAASAPVELPADHYDMLQLSPKADPDTIHRVFRMLAQRYHPDNPETGDTETFQLIAAAYQTLSDPEKRAAYDVQRTATRETRWRVFGNAGSTHGAEGERHKRRGILSALYTKCVHDLQQPSMAIRDMEDLLGIPREHLEFSLWYLKERGFVTRGDNGRFTITITGVDEAESAITDASVSKAPRLSPPPGFSAERPHTGT